MLGVQYGATDQISIRVKGIIPGKTKLNLTAIVPGAATVKPKKPAVTFTANIELEVFEKLVLIEPEIGTPSSILMSPFSTLQLKTNLDGAVKVLYRYVRVRVYQQSIRRFPAFLGKRLTKMKIENL